jgi:hypothetical protein
MFSWILPGEDCNIWQNFEFGECDTYIHLSSFQSRSQLQEVVTGESDNFAIKMNKDSLHVSPAVASR